MTYQGGKDDVSPAGQKIIEGLTEAVDMAKLMAENKRLRREITETADMMANCAGVSNMPDSLPQMVLAKLRAAIPVYAPEGDGDA